MKSSRFSVGKLVPPYLRTFLLLKIKQLQKVLEVLTLPYENEPNAGHDKHPSCLNPIFVLENWQHQSAGDIRESDCRHAISCLLLIHVSYFL